MLGSFEIRALPEFEWFSTRGAWDVSRSHHAVHNTLFPREIPTKRELS